MIQQGIGKLVLKKQNRRQVLKLIKTMGPMSRIDIADTLHLTRAAVTIIINEMIEQNVLAEIGEEHRSSTEKAPKGRKKILIDINRNFRFAIGAVIEDDCISVGLCTISGAVLDKSSADIKESDSIETIMDCISSAAEMLISNSCLDAESILGIGIGVEPSMYVRLGVTTNEDGSCDFGRLNNLLRNPRGLPVIYDNSIKGIAYANLDFFRDKCLGASNAVMLSYGWNYYSVVIAADEAIEGYNLASCSIDKIIVAPGGEALDGYPDGSVKAELSLEALCRRVRRIYSEKNTPILYKLTGGDIEAATYSMIFDAYTLGDKGVEVEKKRSIQYLTVLINNILYAINPQVIILHDFSSLDKDIAEFRKVLPRTVLHGDDSKVVRSGIEPKHAFLGGAALAIRKFFIDEGGCTAKNIIDIDYI